MEHKTRRCYLNEQLHWKGEYSLEIPPPRLILLGLNSMLSENIAGNIISYSNFCRLLKINRDKDARQTSHFRFATSLIDTDMRVERTIVQFMKRERCVSTVKIVIKRVALSEVADRHA